MTLPAAPITEAADTSNCFNRMRESVIIPVALYFDSGILLLNQIYGPLPVLQSTTMQVNMPYIAISLEQITFRASGMPTSVPGIKSVHINGICYIAYANCK